MLCCVVRERCVVLCCEGEMSYVVPWRRVGYIKLLEMLHSS